MLRFSVKSGESFMIGQHSVCYDQPTSTMRFKLFSVDVVTGTVITIPVSGYEVNIHCLSIGVYAKLGFRVFSKAGNEVVAEHIQIHRETFRNVSRRKRRGKASH